METGMTEEDGLLVEISDGVATLTLNRPKQKNALNGSMRDGLRDAVQRIRADRSVRAVVCAAPARTSAPVATSAR
jgi:enoyl-CoA hydratase/carnithine racemase